MLMTVVDNSNVCPGDLIH